MRNHTIIRRSLAAAATIAIVGGPLAACSTDDGGSTASGSESSQSQEQSQQQSPPEPVAEIEALSGQDTAVALDKGFTDALTQLKLTPGTVGDGKLQDGSLVFPITGGNVTVFEPGQVSPYVIGQVQHEGSGFSLTAGDTTVEITNLNVDPGVSRVYGDVTLNGKPVVTSAFIFQLDGRTLEPLKTQGDNAVLTGTKVSISDAAAPLLNDAFGTDAVKPGLLVGTATITVNTTPAS